MRVYLNEWYICFYNVVFHDTYICSQAFYLYIKLYDIYAYNMFIFYFSALERGKLYLAYSMFLL